MTRQRTSLVVALSVAVVMLIGGWEPVASGHTTQLETTVKPKTKPKVTTKAKAKAKAKSKATGKTKKKPTTTKRKVKKRSSTTLTTLAAVPTVPPTSAGAETTSPSPVSVATVPPDQIPSIAPPPGPTAATTTTTTRPATTTTLAPAPFPAPANPPSRATAATLDPYRGLGTWVDRFDWTVRWGGKTPRVSAATVDTMYTQGIQTIYIQAAYWGPGPDILEPERLIPIIDRAHQLGMYVVVWYLPYFQDVNTDLQRTVAIANLDVDGINIDIEERSGVVNVVERTRRLIAYSGALRQLLPGRMITNDIVATVLMDGAPNLYPSADGKIKASAPWWGGPFPYKEIAAAYDLWMIQGYWTVRTADSGWRDGYRYTLENINRLRANLGRPDVPVHMIGGIGGSALTLNELSGMLQASREANSFGLSMYDWVVTQPQYYPYLWGFRWNPTGVVDPRFVPVAPPPYVQQPRPTTTIPAPTLPPTTGVPIVSAPLVTLPPSVPPS